MNLNELQKANHLVAKIEETKKKLFLYERCKLVSITFRAFDEDEKTYSDVVVTKEIPSKVIKNNVIEALKSELGNLESQFERFLTPKTDKAEMMILTKEPPLAETA